MNKENNYDDIINLPHHVSDKHPQMTMHDRAAQFSPFAALTGHNDAIKETARLTDRRIELSEEVKEELSRKLLYIAENISDKPVVTISYFVEDKLKQGGEYVTLRESIIKFNEDERYIITYSHHKINIDDIYDLQI